MRSRRRLLLAAALLAAPLALGAVGPAPPGVDPAEYDRATRTILCTCGCSPQSAHDCACSHAADMRDAIAADLRSGKTADQVIAAYVARYGEKIRIAPTTRGFNLVAWIGPSIGFLAAAWVLSAVLLRWRRAGGADPAPAPAGPGADDPYRSVLDRQLKEYE